MQTEIVSAPGAHKALGFVFKVTERCNLACPYCYFFFAGDDSYKEHPALVPPDTVDGVVRFIRDAVENNGVTYVSIGFHGGEPLLLKKGYFAEICRQLRAEVGTVCKLRLSLQTNGVLLDPEWIELFCHYRVDVGVSFDGDEAAHNKTRVTKKGRGTYTETARGWHLLTEAHRAGRLLEPGILCVVAPDADGAATLRHFVDALGARNIDFLLPDITRDAIDANEHFVARCGKYLLDVCNAWMKYPPGKVKVRYIDQLIKALLNDEVMRLSALQKYDSTSLMTISSDGTLSSDDAFRALAMRFRDTGFNIREHRFEQLRTSEIWRELYQAEQKLPEACGKCLWKNVCRGGAKQHRYSVRRGFDNPSLYCKALSNFYGFVAAELVRGGCSADALEARLTADYG